MTDAFLAGLLAGYGVAIPVGAIAILIIGLTARTSFRVGASAALGVATADGLYALVAVLGGAALAGVIEPIATPLRWIAFVVLLVLAAHTAVVAVRHHRDPARAARSGAGLGTPWRAYGGILALTLLNPMTIVYFAALVLARQAGDELTAGGEVVFVLAAFIASASWQLLIASGGSLVGRLLTGPRGRLYTALASSLLIVVLAVVLVVG
ncbi:lysine transporter LysE [Asanoa ishikariensis]|uniref:Arginine exporter protein ArgO n=1 Tax=Asanoa ishikariensis TaxID=137265 RepID=A0A1H3PFT7_9ACTN|nr:LysE family transporter [Asanoa ishikariensis]GIF67845.1 lysine transporter LysE [Asanoa ishikariensis]SDY99823.1 Arginine exporter protein ArgO [Asanoa ishikariensis]